MDSRLVDFLFAVALLLLVFSGTTLMVYAAMRIGVDLMQAVNRLLTAWQYHRGGPGERDLLLNQPRLRDLLTMGRLFERSSPAVGVAYVRDLRRLEQYRYAQARNRDGELIWDRRLGALLTPDEHAYLYGAPESLKTARLRSQSSEFGRGDALESPN